MGSHYKRAELFAAQPTSVCRATRIEGRGPRSELFGLDSSAPSKPRWSPNFLRQAIAYASRPTLNVINESFGSNPFPDTTRGRVSTQVQCAGGRGRTTVTRSPTGIRAWNNNSASPGQPDPRVIAVALLLPTVSGPTRRRTTGRRLFRQQNRCWTTTSARSAQAGVTAIGRTVNLVAPASLGFASAAPDLDLGIATRAAAAWRKPVAGQWSGGTARSSRSPLTPRRLVIRPTAQTHEVPYAHPAVSIDTDHTATIADRSGLPASDQGPAC